MRRNLRNAVAVLVVTGFTTLAVFATVQLTDRVTGVSLASATAPSTGQAVSSGNGAQYGYGSGAGYRSSYGTPGSGSLTCPATGCTASSCHAAH